MELRCRRPDRRPAIVENRGAACARCWRRSACRRACRCSLGGDELGRTQRGNNNAYCQDNELSWIDWAAADHELIDLRRRRLIDLRTAHPVFRRRRFFEGKRYAAADSSDIGVVHAPTATPMSRRRLARRLRPHARRVLERRRRDRYAKARARAGPSRPSSRSSVFVRRQRRRLDRTSRVPHGLGGRRLAGRASTVPCRAGRTRPIAVDAAAHRGELVGAGCFVGCASGASPSMTPRPSISPRSIRARAVRDRRAVAGRTASAASARQRPGLAAALRARGVDVEVVLPDYDNRSLDDETVEDLDVPGWVGTARARRGVDASGRLVTLVDVPAIARPHPYVDPRQARGGPTTTTGSRRSARASPRSRGSASPTSCISTTGTRASRRRCSATACRRCSRSTTSRIKALAVPRLARPAPRASRGVSPGSTPPTRLAGAIALADRVVAVSPNYAARDRHRPGRRRPRRPTERPRRRPRRHPQRHRHTPRGTPRTDAVLAATLRRRPIPGRRRSPSRTARPSSAGPTPTSR